MKQRILVVTFLFSSLLLAASGPALAHHSWGGYDSSNLTAVKGTVTQFDWGNPHIWVNFEVRDETGTIENWRAGGPSPNHLANTGWDKNTLKPGDQITFVGNRIKDGTFSMKLQKIVLPDGRELSCSRRR